MSFSAEETAFLRSQPLARLATVSADGQPDVVPVGFEFDGKCFWVGGPGASILATRKFRHVLAGNQKVGLVVDELISFDPFIARGIRVYGYAEAPIERDGMVGPGNYMRITPTSPGVGTERASRSATAGMSRVGQSTKSRDAPERGLAGRCSRDPSSDACEEKRWAPSYRITSRAHHGEPAAERLGTIAP
jgi:pyridoxamine 5'-phosphate oxidase family protein